MQWNQPKSSLILEKKGEKGGKAGRVEGLESAFAMVMGENNGRESYGGLEMQEKTNNMRYSPDKNAFKKPEYRTAEEGENTIRRVMRPHEIARQYQINAATPITPSPSPTPVPPQK